MRNVRFLGLPVAVLAASAVMVFGAAPASAQSSGSFLCYSVGGDPTYEPDQASALAGLHAGYWLPEAVPGNIPQGMGENLGPYHLDCFDAPVAGGFGNTTAAAQYADGAGNLLPGSYVTSSIVGGIGTYPIYGLPATT